jgi:hypothetical protein
VKGISLWQPWASYVANGAKKIETRGKRTLYRGRLAIHAAKRYDSNQKRTHGRINMRLHDMKRDDLVVSGLTIPLGEVVALVDLVDVVEMTPEWIAARSPLELRLGNYRPGRWGWILKNVRPVTGVPLRGRQWLWALGREDTDWILRAAGEPA